jgi:nicotinate-nucleotide pyrophosphorylase (carboxylating)
LNVDALIRAALAEDLTNERDLTTDFFVPENTTSKGWIEARVHGVVSGVQVVEAVFKTVDDSLSIEHLVSDGEEVKPLAHLLNMTGRATSILRAERTALNFLCHLSGIATLTSQFVERTRQWHTQILCTRKTTPGLRELEVAAVRHGGGEAYRTNLSDAVLLKDNHLEIIGGMSGVERQLHEMKRKDRQAAEHLLAAGKIEVSSLEEIEHAHAMGWRQMLLDNFAVADVATTVRHWGNKISLEVSGGVNLENVADYAATGVQAISIGALTHSAKAMDFSLEVEGRRL